MTELNDVIENKTENLANSNLFNDSTDKNSSSSISSSSSIVKEVFTSEPSKQIIYDIDNKITLLVNLIKSKNYSVSRRKYYTKKIINKIIDNKYACDISEISTDFGHRQLQSSTPHNLEKAENSSKENQEAQSLSTPIDTFHKKNVDSYEKHSVAEDISILLEKNKPKSDSGTTLQNGKTEKCIEKSPRENETEPTLSDRYKKIFKDVKTSYQEITPRRLKELYKLEFSMSSASNTVSTLSKESPSSNEIKKNDPATSTADWKYYKTISEINMDKAKKQTSDDYLYKYVELEKVRQLEWINNEMACLTKLKNLLEKHNSDSFILNPVPIVSRSTSSSSTKEDNSGRTDKSNILKHTSKEMLGEINSCLHNLRVMLNRKSSNLISTANNTSSEETSPSVRMKVKSLSKDRKIPIDKAKSNASEKNVCYLHAPTINYDDTEQICQEHINKYLTDNLKSKSAALNYEENNRMFHSADKLNINRNNKTNKICDSKIIHVNSNSYDTTANKDVFHSRKILDNESSSFSDITNKRLRNVSNLGNMTDSKINFEKKNFKQKSLYFTDESDKENSGSSSVISKSQEHLLKKKDSEMQTNNKNIMDDKNIQTCNDNWYEIKIIKKSSDDFYSDISKATSANISDKKISEVENVLKYMMSDNECVCCKCGKVRKEKSSYIKNSNSVAYFLTFQEVSNGEETEITKSKSHLKNITIKVPKKPWKKESSQKCKKCQIEDQSSDLALQDYLYRNRADFIKSAEWRRQCMAELIYMRDKHYADFNGKAHYQMLFTTQEMKKNTNKKYKKSHEAQEKLRLLRTQQQKIFNRELAAIFSKKLQQKTLKGQVTLSTSKIVINS